MPVRRLRAVPVPRLFARLVPARGARRDTEPVRQNVRPNSAVAPRAAAAAAHLQIPQFAAAAAARAVLPEARARSGARLGPGLHPRVVPHVQRHRRRPRARVWHRGRAHRLLLAVRGHRGRHGLLRRLLVRRETGRSPTPRRFAHRPDPPTPLPVLRRLAHVCHFS